MRKTIPAIDENTVLKSFALPGGSPLCSTRCAELAWRLAGTGACRRSAKGQCPKSPVPEKPSARRGWCPIPAQQLRSAWARSSGRPQLVHSPPDCGGPQKASLIGTGSIFARCLAADNHWRSAPGLALAGRCICAVASRDAGGNGGPLTALVRIALRRPYTFVVLAILILLRGAWRSCARRSTSFPRSAFR